MSLLETATSWLVEPARGEADAARRPPLAVVPGPVTSTLPLSRPAVIGTAASVPPLAAAVGLACRARARVPAALVALWPNDGADPPRHRGGPVLPGAAAFAARLHRRDLPAVARGRLVWLTLPGEAPNATTMLRHAEATAGDLPTVLAIARPRDRDVEALLAERDLLVIAAAPDSPLATAIRQDDATHGLPAHTCAPLPPGAARLATLAGLRGPRLDVLTTPTDRVAAPL